MWHLLLNNFLVLKSSLFLAGFINLGASQNRQIANFQYVAPLMAYFDPSLDDSSSVHHLDNGKPHCEQYTVTCLTYQDV